MNFDGMAYRGDKTDPLEVIIQRRRRMRRMALLMLLGCFFPMLWRIDLSRIASLRAEPSATVAAPRPRMSAHALEQLLRSTPASRRAPRDVRCTPDQNGWDYVCTYRTDLPHPLSRLRIGVRVSSNRILQASAPHQLDRPLPSP
jgi:hypothetical protein